MSLRPIRIKGSSHNWAQTAGVSKSFIYLPCWETSGATIANYGNVGPATFAITGTHDAIDWSVPGYYMGDGDAVGTPDTTYVASTDADFLSLLKFTTGATDGVGGTKGILIAMTYKTPATLAAGNFVGYGNVAYASTGLGWRFGNDASNFVWKVGPTASGAVALAALPAVSTEVKVVLWMDAENGNLVMYIDNVSQTIAAASTILGQMDSAQSASNADVGMLFCNNTAASGTTITPASTLSGKIRNFLIMDGSDLTAAQVARIAAEYQKAPNYTVPRYLGDL